MSEQAMTAGELAEALRAYPADTPVYYSDGIEEHGLAPDRVPVQAVVSVTHAPLPGEAVPVPVLAYVRLDGRLSAA
jgi:hypothetical protein